MPSNLGSDTIHFPQNVAYHSRIHALMTRLPLWFNRDHKTPAKPPGLASFLEGRHYLSTKQVPSSTILRTAGSSSVTANRDKLLQSGFTLTEQSPLENTSRDLVVKRLIEGEPSMRSNSLASLLEEAADLADRRGALLSTVDSEDTSHSGSEIEPDEALLNETFADRIRFRRKSRYRVKYEDPWKIQAGYILSDIYGQATDIVVWSGDGIRLQDPLPPRILGPTWQGHKTNKVRFSAIADDACKTYVIYNHTHWGKCLRNMELDPKNELHSWAKTLSRRLRAFLRGKSDPSWSKRRKELLWGSQEDRPKKQRAERLIELLKTVDGIFTQRYLCYPEEVWDWSRFDLFTLGNISYLIGDEFLDGELTDTAMLVDTCYSQLKRARKWFKYHSHRGDIERALKEDLHEIPTWCRQFLNVWTRSAAAEGHRKLFLIGLLSQTRGCGTPPPLVVLQSKVKFLQTVSLEPPPMEPYTRSMRKEALGEVLGTLPDSAFTGLATKARVTVTTSSCWESTRREGGTVEAIRSLIAAPDAGHQVPVRDLENGSITRWLDVTTCSTVGELVFYYCLDQVLRIPPKELRYAFLTVVKEPGKARSVTKARACLKVVLDLVNKICSEPLKKGIKSSTSGMAQSNHGWNFFNRLCSDEMKEEVFSLYNREENPYEGYIERDDAFEDIFVSSTDYEEATDQMRHDVARDLGDAWMRKCGIPSLLRGIVVETCYKPRTIFFHANGVLNTIGQPAPEFGENIRSIQLVRGVLMGDPLTKVTLHLTNVVARHLGARLNEPDFYVKFANGMEAYNEFKLGIEHGSTH